MQSSVLGTALPEPSCWRSLNLVSGSLLWEGSLISIKIIYCHKSFHSCGTFYGNRVIPSSVLLALPASGIASGGGCQRAIWDFKHWLSSSLLSTPKTQLKIHLQVEFVEVFHLCPLYPYFWNLLFVNIALHILNLWDPGGMLVVWLQYEILTHITSE